MPAKRYVLTVLTAVAAVVVVATCSDNPNGFRGTVVAPLETLSAFTPGPEVYATLTAKPAMTQAVALSRTDTPTPRPPSPTPRPPTPTSTATPPPPTATPQPATPTVPRTPTPTPPPRRGLATVAPDVYLDVPQRVGVLGDTWTLTDIRVGTHPQRIRVVWEMDEARQTAPLTEVVEVDNIKSPFPRGGGLIDSSWGAARIDIMISDCYAYKIPLGERLPIAMPDDSVVTKVGLHPTFDDALLGFSIGLSEPAAYEIFTLTDPVRIVVDVMAVP